jgi:pimeloyl-ACP methyl ester carboxylesterase
MTILPNIANKKNITVNGREYPVIEAGEGPLVVCLHGFPDNYESFQNQIEPFVAAGYRPFSAIGKSTVGFGTTDPLGQAAF